MMLPSRLGWPLSLKTPNMGNTGLQEETHMDSLLSDDEAASPRWYSRSRWSRYRRWALVAAGSLDAENCNPELGECRTWSVGFPGPRGPGLRSIGSYRLADDAQGQLLLSRESGDLSGLEKSIWRQCVAGTTRFGRKPIWQCEGT